jgi:hypothetical protein
MKQNVIVCVNVFGAHAHEHETQAPMMRGH